MEPASGADEQGGQPPPAPSPLSGAYLLIVVGEPHTDAHREDILRKIANGFLSWDGDSCHVGLDKELQAIISQAPEGEEARNGERLIQFASESLVTEVLIQPQLNTLIQCIRNLLSSFTKHRHIIHAGYTFTGNGSWILQDGTFSLADLVDAFQEPEVQRVLRAYENSVTVDIHCAPEGEWSTARMRRETFSRLCRVRVNPDDGTSPAPNIQQFVDYLAPFVQPASVEQLLEPSEVVGNIRFSHPTLYVFPGGQGDAALFGINGFNMLVDGGFARKACFWDFARHLDRLDAVLMTRLNNGNVQGLASVLRRKRLSHVYPQIGHFFCNLQDRKQPSTPEEEKMRDPLLLSLLDEGQEMVQNLRQLQMKPHVCVRDSTLEPINLYHKVGHGKLDMYVISPAKDSRELKEFLTKWHSHDASLFSGASKRDFTFPLQNLVSVCALLVWQPANPDDTITRILFPGSTPQHKIFEGLEKLRSLEFMRTPVCTANSLSPSSSTIGISTKVSKVKSTPAVIDKLLPGEGLTKPIPRSQIEPSTKNNIIKTATIPVSGASETKLKPAQPPMQKPVKPKQDKPKMDLKTDLDKNIEADTKQDKPAIISEQLKEPGKIKTDKLKSEPKPKKVESKALSKATEKKPIKSSSVEKKDSVKSSPTTPKKSIETKVNGVATTKTETVKSSAKPTSRTKTSPSATPAKSTKEENNRKVVESKVKSAYASKSAGKPPKRDESVTKAKPDKKTAKRTSSSSPAKLPAKSTSPVKAVTKTITKGKKEPKKVKGENDKGIVTDSSAVSTPSTVDAETAIKGDNKVGDEDKSIENIKDAEKEYENKLEKGNIEEDTNRDVDEIIESKEKLDETSIGDEGESDQKVEEKLVEREEEEDEILIIEKVEIEQYGEDSIHDQESLESHVPDEVEDEIQKHLRDEAESEKKKDDHTKTEEIQEKEEESLPVVVDKDSSDEIKAEVEPTQSDIQPCDLALSLNKDLITDKVLTPEDREQIEEEVQEIITSATDFVAKAKLEQSKESSELSAEGVGSDEQKTSGETKDLLSSTDKQNISSDKILTEDDNKLEDTKDKSKDLGDGRYGAEESQPDEKFSTTVESGATTAPTLPEDERIPLDDIKEGVEEKYDKEETKEKDSGVVHPKLEQPTTLPQVSVVPGGTFETQATMLARDIVKTPDEVADLPVHEEVDGLYEHDFVSREAAKSKEDLLSVNSGKKETGVNEDEKGDSEKVGKDMSDKDKYIGHEEEVPKDVKADEDELKELTLIRQRLEQEDAKLGEVGETIDQTDTGKTVVDEMLIEQGEELQVGDVIVEEELVHSTLRAPEKAELVVVTPDSAPDSPLHLLGQAKTENNVSAELKSSESKVIEAGIDIQEVVNEPNADRDMKTDQVELDKKVSPESTSPLQSNLDASEQHKQLHSGIIVSIQSNLLDSIGDYSADGDQELKGTISTPKTPPATPILSELEKSIDKFEIIQETSSDVNIDDKHISLFNKRLDETIEEVVSVEQENVDDGLKELNVKETTMHSTSVEIPASIPPNASERVCGATGEVELDTPKSLSPTPTGKKDSLTPTVDDKESDKITPTTVSPVPVGDDEVKAIVESSTLPEIIGNIIEPPHGDFDKQKPSLSKPVSPASSLKDETESNVVYDKKLDTSKSPISIETIDIRHTLDEKHDIPKSVSPVLTEPEDKHQIKKEESETIIDAKRDDVKSVSPSFSHKDDSELCEDMKQGELEENRGTLTIARSVSPDKEDLKATNLVEEQVISNVDEDIGEVNKNLLDKDSSKLQGQQEKQDIQKPVSPTLSEKEKEITPLKVDSSAFEGSIQVSLSSAIKHEEKKDLGKEHVDHLQEKQDSKSGSPVPCEEDKMSFEKNKEMHVDECISGSSVSVETKPFDETGVDHQKTTEEDKFTVSQHQGAESYTLLEKETIKDTEEDKISQLQDKEISPKSVSPVFSDRDQSDKLCEDKSQLLSRNITPKSASPVSSEKRYDDIGLMQEQISLLDNTILDTLSSVVSGESERKDSKDLSQEKVEILKNLSPDRGSDKDEIEPLEENIDTPKSISPIPSERKEPTISLKDETIKLHDKKIDSTLKSLSPTPIEKEGEIKSSGEEPSTLQEDETTKSHYVKLDSSPKSLSPTPTQKQEDINSSVRGPEDLSIIQKEEISKPHDEELVSSIKSCSPTPIEKVVETISAVEEPSILQKEGTTKTHDQELASSIKSSSPTPIDKVGETISSHEPSILLEEGMTEPHDRKLDSTPKSASPVPSENEEGMISSVKESKEQMLHEDASMKLHDEKLDSSPKSSSPILSETEKGTISSVGEPEKPSILHEDETIKESDQKLKSSPTSSSPTFDGKKEETKSSVEKPEESSILQKAELTNLQDEEVLSSPKCPSPIPSEKECDTRPSYGEPEEPQQVDGKLGSSPKCISPNPTEQREETTSLAIKPEESTVIEKCEKTVLHGEKLDSSPKSSTTSEKEEETKSSEIKPEESSILQIDELTKPHDEKLDSSPKCLSPIPSEKENETRYSSGEPEDSRLGDERLSSSPKCASPIPSEKAESKSSLRDSKDHSTVQKDEITREHDGKCSPSPICLSPIPCEKREDKRDSLKSSSPLDTEGSGPEQLKEDTLLDKCDIPKSISPVPSDISDTKDKLDTPKSLSPVPSIISDTKDKVDTPTSVSPVPSEKSDSKAVTVDDSKIENEEITPKSISPLLNEIERSKHTEHEGSTAVDSTKCVSPKSTSPAPSDKSDKEKIVDDKQETPQSLSPIPTHTSNIAYLPNNSEEVLKDNKHYVDVTSESSNAKVMETSLESEIDLEIEKSDRPKSISPITIDKEDMLKENLGSSISASPDPNNKTEEEKHDIQKGDVDRISPKSVSPVLLDKDHSMETLNIQVPDATEKSEIESSEKQKGDGLCLSKLHEDSASSSSKTTSVKNVPLKTEEEIFDVEEKGTLETLQSEKSLDSSSSSVDKVNGNKSEILTSHDEPVLQIEKVAAPVLTQTSLNTKDLIESSSPDSVLDIKHDSPSGSPEKSSSDKCDTSTASTVVSQQAPFIMNGHSDKTIITTSADVVTHAVMEDKLASKDSKTVESVKSESENKVPSNVSPSKKPVVETGSSLSSIVSGVSSITEAEKSDTGSILPYESSEEHSSVSVHRMLVTGSSEDGGAETELCSSSVTQITSDAIDKQMGNVSHQAAESDVKTQTLSEKAEQPFMSSGSDKSSSLDKTVITTHYTVDGKTDPDTSSSGDVIKTITTTITKLPNQPGTEVTTTLSGGKEETNMETTKSSKSDSEFSIGVQSQSLKKEISDGRRSGTPASDGGPSTPHSDISSGQVSRAATNVWGESSEGRPDSRHCDSDDDMPCSPMSATSHIAQSPPQFDFDIHQHSKGEYYEDPKIKEFAPSAMTSSIYGNLPEVDPLDEYLRTQKPMSAESQMCSSMYVSKYDDDEEEPVKSETTQGQFEAIFKSTKDDIDFETAIKEHISARGEDLTTKFTNGKKETIDKPETNGKSTYSEYSTNGHMNGKSSQPESLEYQESQLPSSVASSSAITQKPVSDPPLLSEAQSSSSTKPAIEEKKDPIEGWGKPLGLPPPPKNLIDSPLGRSSLTLVWNPADEWGIPLGLPSPAPPPVKKDSMNGEMEGDITSTSNKTTPKKVARRNAENKSASNAPIGKEAINRKHPESPVKRSTKDSKSKPVSPVYMDLTYVPHHGNSHYSTVEFFKRVRARYYVFSGTEPSREVFNALLEAKQTWEDKDLEVTIIPTYDTDTLGYWVAEHEDTLAKCKIDLSPSASRCTINLQDHETSCSAYRLEF